MDRKEIMGKFLQHEITSQGIYKSIINFIVSPHIRCGEFECNDFIIKKMDLQNFFLYPEYELQDGEKEYAYVISINKDNILKEINEYALLKEMDI